MTINEPYTLIRDDVPGLYFVQGERNGYYPHSNAMLVQVDEQTREAVLIDCGPGHAALRKLRKNFVINRVYLTHWHEDHTIDHGLLRDATFYCNLADIPPLLDVEKLMDLYGFDAHVYRDRFKMYIDSLGVEPFHDVQPLHESVIEINDDHRLEIILAPGHSAGHCVMYEPECKIAFLADIDLSSFGPWYGCTDSSLIDFEATINKVAGLDIDVAITSHKGIFTREQLGPALQAFKEKIWIRNATILELLSETTPKRAIDLTGQHVVYKTYDLFKEYFLVAEKIMIEHHLEYLESKQQVNHDRDGYLLA
jgi:glyoxylase-like metal-dependent hydrolase (beta-lactamase superfamily II)